MPEGYISLAYINHHYDWNWELADSNFKKGIQLNSDYSIGHHWYAIFLSSRSSFSKAETHITKAKELDPLSMVIKTAEGWIKYMSGDYKSVVSLLNEATSNDLSFPWSYYVLAQAYEGIGDYDLAIKNYQHAVSNIYENSSNTLGTFSLNE